MSYTKNSWSTGDTITATKLNHLEGGVYNADAAATAAAPLLVPFTLAVDGEGHISASTEADYASTRAEALAGRQIYAVATAPGTDLSVRSPLWGISETDLFFSVLILPNSGGDEAQYYSIYWSAIQVLFVSHTVALS